MHLYIQEEGFHLFLLFIWVKYQHFTAVDQGAIYFIYLILSKVFCLQT